MKMKKAKTIKFQATAYLTWECPHCKTKQTSNIPVSPYRAIAEELTDELCKTCNEFVELTLYEEKEE